MKIAEPFLRVMIRRSWVQTYWGQFLTKFILFCVTLDLSDNLTEMHQIFLSLKTRVTTSIFTPGGRDAILWYKTIIALTIVQLVFILDQWSVISLVALSEFDI